jgi:FkbM family methyltransferase
VTTSEVHAVKRRGIVVNARGQKIHFDPEDERGRALAEADGNLNPSSLQLWNSALALFDWDYVVDVGCNYGEMLVGGVIPVGAHLRAFEPNPKVLPYLHRTLNDFDRSVDLREIAVGRAEAEKATFSIDLEWSGMSSLNVEQPEVPSHRSTTTMVPVSTLDSQLADIAACSVCLKIDVEGRELDVIEGASTLLNEGHRWAMVIEVLHMTIDEIVELASRFHMYLSDARTGTLVPVQGRNRSILGRLLSSGWLYPQDALLVSSPDIVRRSET